MAAKTGNLKPEGLTHFLTRDNGNPCNKNASINIQFCPVTIFGKNPISKISLKWF